MTSLPRLLAVAGVLLLLAAGPARAASTVEGLWCGIGLLHEFSLDLTQPSPDEVNGTLSRKQRKRELHGTLEGNVLRTQTTKVGSLVLELDGAQLRIVDGDGPLALTRGQAFTRAHGAACSG